MANLGKRNFEGCQLKSLDTSAWKEASAIVTRHNATLVCPRSEGDNRLVVAQKITASGAMRTLAKIAAQQLCGTCPYSSMDQIQFVERRVVEADAERAALKAEIGLIKTQQERDDLLKQITDGINRPTNPQLPAAAAPEIPPSRGTPPAQT